MDVENAGFVRDEDVLDTWFSSALWPISTMGWPSPEAFPETVGLLEKFNPSTVEFPEFHDEFRSPILLSYTKV